MIVKTMKKLLEEMNPNARVLLNDPHGNPCRVVRRNDDTIILSSDGKWLGFTVAGLIEVLNQMNEENRVLLNHIKGDECLFVLSAINHNDFIWMEGESDIDLEDELNVRFERAFEEQMDELDFYMDLVEIGITPDMVRRTLGNEKGNIMQEFCEEHGLI